jgi:GT2 family glycosyltransferase
VSSPAVVAIVLNWNSGPDCLTCLAALARTDYAPLRVLVVDNGSTDGSVDAIRAAMPEVEVLELGVNCGYAAGNNRGIAWALARGAQYVWILNPDVLVDPACLRTLIAGADGVDRAGLLAPAVYFRESPDVLFSAGGVLRAGWAVHRGIGERDTGQYAAPAEVDFLTGCALLASRRMIEVAGGMDERFFLYAEDVEWSMRARAAGFRVVAVPGARAWHPDTRRRDDCSARLTYYLARNHLMLIRMHHLGAAALVRHLTRHAVTLLSWSVRPRWRYRRAQRDALWRALMDFARGRMGPAPDL